MNPEIEDLTAKLADTDAMIIKFSRCLSVDPTNEIVAMNMDSLKARRETLLRRLTKARHEP